MEDPESTAQLSLPPRFGAKAEVIKLPLPEQTTPSGKKGTEQGQIKKPDSLWYAVYFPQLIELSESQQQKYLNELAAVLESVSSTVSFHPQALICEIRSGLKYFGDIDAIHDKVNEPLSEALKQLSLADYFLYAACPTVTGSLLLARSGHNLSLIHI